MATDRAQKQWVDLGTHTEVCMTQPETCGAAGGAIGFWIKVDHCFNVGGIISTRKYNGSGSLVYCREDIIR